MDAGSANNNAFDQQFLVVKNRFLLAPIYCSEPFSISRSCNTVSKFHCPRVDIDYAADGLRKKSNWFEKCYIQKWKVHCYR